MKSELKNPIQQALDRIEKIRIRKMQNQDSIILEGLFVLAVATFENSLSETLRILLRNIPEKLDIKNESVRKEDLIEGMPLESVIERVIAHKSYRNLKEYLSFFIKTTDTNVFELFETDDFFYLQEIKARRNLLLHNNLTMNSIYKETAGKFAHTEDNGLDINQDYLYQSILRLISILELFISKIESKYKKFTKINAVKNLFDYIFPSNLMTFENEWKVDRKNDKIVSRNMQQSLASGLSSSEKLFFDIWVDHFEGMGRITTNIDFYSLDKINRDKLGLLISRIDLIRKQ